MNVLCQLAEISDELWLRFTGRTQRLRWIEPSERETLAICYRELAKKPAILILVTRTKYGLGYQQRTFDFQSQPPLPPPGSDLEQQIIDCFDDQLAIEEENRATFQALLDYGPNSEY